MSASGQPLHLWQPGPDGCTLQLSGDWRGERALTLTAPPPITGGVLVVDTAELQSWDGALTAALHERLAPLARSGIEMRLQALPQDVRAVLLDAMPESGDAPPPEGSPQPGVFTRIGLWLQSATADALATATFLGEVLLATGRLLRGRSGMRGIDLWRQIDQVGPQSIPIVGLTCFLMGLILAYMGGAQLDRIGAQAYIPGVVTVGMLRELAGLMTGVILSGRVGAAYAAQLATMKAGEEIDALRVLGIDPIDYLVMPRMLALTLVAPLLIAFASALGIVAGMLAAAGVYGLPMAEYVTQSLNSLKWNHLWIGQFKGIVYAALVALAGCREGLAAGLDARAVGQATTTAVVKSLVWIVVAACVTTVVFQSLGF